MKAPDPDQLFLPLMGIAPPRAPDPLPETFPMPATLKQELAEWWHSMQPGKPIPYSLFGQWYHRYRDPDFIMAVVEDTACRGVYLREDVNLVGYVQKVFAEEGKKPHDQRMKRIKVNVPLTARRYDNKGLSIYDMSPEDRKKHQDEAERQMLLQNESWGLWCKLHPHLDLPPADNRFYEFHQKRIAGAGGGP